MRRVYSCSDIQKAFGLGDVCCNSCHEDDEAAVREYLKPRWAKLVEMWEGIAE